MERLKAMKDTLIGCVQGQLTHLDTVDTKELGEAVDMIKDLSEAVYYCAITKSMEEKEKKGAEPIVPTSKLYYPVMYYPPVEYREGNTTDGRDNSRGGQGNNYRRGGGRRRNYEEEEMMYPVEMMPYPHEEGKQYYRDMDKMEGRMYYGGGGSGSGSGGGGNSSGGNSGSSSGGSGNRSYTEREIPFTEMMRDRREGRSGQSRKMYMESKEMHKDKASQLQELDKYAQELTSDLVEMVEGATPEEKQLLSNRIAALATKIK